MEPPNSKMPLDGIAIIGMAGRFPGAGTTDELWQNLCAGIEGVHRFSDEELAAAGVSEELFKNPKYVKAAGVLENIELFDAEFFGYSPREAEVTDPQHRLFLECAWHALEDAGWDSSHYGRPIGIFAGAGANTYLFNLYADPEIFARLDSNQITIGNEREYLTSRVAYKLDLRGPAVTVQTACSTSLVAVHMATQSLLNYECDMALAGGVLVCAQRSGYLYIEGGFLSPDGRNRSFDAEANGSVGGNGVCLVVLRRLEDAVKEGDRIYAVIKGSAINNDGTVKAGFTAPGIQGQAEVIARAQALAGVAPETISYMEAHGTATALGDPAEIAAYKRAFHQVRNNKNFCAIGSIKSNLGHLGEAAGVTGLVKTALSLFHKKIVPSLHFQTPNPVLNLEDSPFYVNTKLMEWCGSPRRAGVSSFGIGGTNVHVVLEEAPDVPASEPCTRAQLLILSAKTKTALEAVSQNLSSTLDADPGLNLADVAFTLQTGRRAFRHRSAVVCSDLSDAAQVLAEPNPERFLIGKAPKEEPHPVFLFPGVGDHYVGMAQELYEQVPFFRSVLDECFKSLAPLLECAPWISLFGKPNDAERSQASPQNAASVDFRRMVGRAQLVNTEGLRLTSQIHPILFSLEYALARLWMEWGIHPRFMIGYSLGEYVAACISGVFSLQDALTLIARRAQMIDVLAPGAMLALPFPETIAQRFLDDDVSLAAVNSPNLCVLAGTRNAIARIENQLASEGQVSRRISTTHAFHSRLMNPLSAGLENLLRDIKLNCPSIPYISNVTGDWITADEATNPLYWAQHLSHTVQFSKCVRTALQDSNALFLEVGPGRSLSGLVLQTSSGESDTEPIVVSSLRHAYEPGPDWTNLLGAVGKLWIAGAPIDWMAVHKGTRRRRVSLSGYPFERQRCWIEPRQSKLAGSVVTQPSGVDLADWFYVPVWRRANAEIFMADDPSHRHSWLVFQDEYDIGSELCSRFKALGNDVVCVQASDAYRQNADGSYTIDPAQGSHYDRLLAEVLAKYPELDRIAHFWSVTGPSHTGHFDFDEIQMRGFYSVLNLTSALRTGNPDQSTKMFIVADRLFGVTGSEELCADKSTMLGLAMVAQQENPRLSFKCIDIISETGKENFCASLILEELQSRSRDLMVALRNKQRWVRSYEPLHLPMDRMGNVKLRKHGTYILTGGLGGVGLLVAAYLARAWQANLMLLGRSDFPQPNSWNSLPATCEPAIVNKVAKLQEIQKSGAEVMVAKADVSDEGRMREIFQTTVEKFGAIDGVFHLAGTVVTKAVEEITYGDCETQFQAKICGTWVLEKVMQPYQPHFCILFSSNAATLGGLGFAAYSAANCFMDAFAAQASKTSATHWISVNWDGWMLPEQEGQVRGQNSTIARYVMKPTESVDALARVLSMAYESQIVVSRLSLDDRVKLWIEREGLFEKGTTPAGTTIPQHRRPQLSNEYVAPRDDMEAELATVFSELLGIEAVGVYDNFFELGGNSLVALQLFARVRHNFDVDLPLRMIFEAPNVFRLKESIEAMRQEILVVLEHLEKEENAGAFES